MGKKPRSKSTRTHRHSDLSTDPKTLTESDLFDMIRSKGPDVLLLVLDSVQDPHNLGACLRTAEGAGVMAVVTTKDRTAPMTQVVRTVACGAAERVPLVRVTNLSRFLGELKNLDVWLIGTSDSAEKSVYDLDLTGSVAFVMGTEGAGLRRLTAENCDFMARIPMRGELSSLNLSVATGICLYEAVRQRNSQTSSDTN